MNKLKVLFPFAAMASISLLSTTAFAASTNTGAVTVTRTDSNIVVVSPAAIQHVSDAILPSKSGPGRPDSAALSELTKSPNFANLNSDLGSGKILMFMANGDGKLTDQLLRAAFNSTGIIVTHQTTGNDPYHLVAKAIANIPGRPMDIFTVYAGGNLSLSDAEQAVTQMYNYAKTQPSSVSTTRATMTPSSGISPNTTPTQSGTQTWSYQAPSAYFQPDSMNSSKVSAKIIYGYNLTRTYVSQSNYSNWDFQYNWQGTPGWTLPGSNVDTSWQWSAIWNSAGVGQMGNQTQPYAGEQMVSDGPGSSSNQYSVAWSLSNDGVSSVQYSETVNGATITNESDAGVYGAWNMAYIRNDPSAEGYENLQESARFQNLYGNFAMTTDWTATLSYNANITDSTGDHSDEINMPDL